MSQSGAVLLLWPDQAPGALGVQPQNIPSITPYLPLASAPTGAAMLICPGGGYGALTPHEGHDYALWLNTLGITCFVVQYRLGTDGYRHRGCLPMRHEPCAWCAPGLLNGRSAHNVLV